MGVRGRVALVGTDLRSVLASTLHTLLIMIS